MLVQGETQGKAEQTDNNFDRHGQSSGTLGKTALCAVYCAIADFQVKII